MITTGSRNISGGHVLRVTLRGEYASLAVRCSEPEGAVCRVMCAADDPCESYDYPDHEHGLKPVLYCHAENYFNGGDYDGMPIEVYWDGDGYEWLPATTAVGGRVL